MNMNEVLDKAEDAAEGVKKGKGGRRPTKQMEAVADAILSLVKTLRKEADGADKG